MPPVVLLTGAGASDDTGPTIAHFLKRFESQLFTEATQGEKKQAATEFTNLN